MPIDIVIPEMGESVRTGVIAKWHKADGESVNVDDIVLDLETDKVTAEVRSPAAGRLKQLAKEGQTVEVGAVIARVEEGAGKPAAKPAIPPVAATPAKAAPPAPAAAPTGDNGHHAASDVRATPLAKKLAEEQGVDLGNIQGTGPGGRVREQDVLAAVSARKPAPSGGGGAVAVKAPAASTPVAAQPRVPASGGVRRERLSPLRQRLAQRLVESQHNAAMLTTFNEVDMTAVMELRKKYKEEFEKKYGVGLGFMAFFVKAVVNAFRVMPVVNSHLVGGADGALEVEHHDFAHISVAVSTPKGLTVPVLRDCQNRSFADIESGIKDLAVRARDGKLTLDDLQGGTFTISNGGIFGSLMSTPILNPPQTAILGLHAIKNRAVEDPDKPGQVAIRPMMYLAMSYDHRLLDGQEAVTFLVAVKKGIEDPERLLLGV